MSLGITLMLLFTPQSLAQHPAAAPIDIPETAKACLQRAGAGYELNRAISPMYLKGDFDHDGTVDYAVAVVRVREAGTAICLSGSPGKVVVLGAGTLFHGFRNLDFSAWHLHRRELKVGPGQGGGAAPKLKGDAFLIDWLERGSALVYWNGKRFVWYQQGD